MRVLVALDKFRGSLSAARATAAVARGVRRAAPGAKVVQRPVADGGEGTLEVLAGPLKLVLRRVRTVDPRGRPRRAPIGMNASGLAVAETARAIGLRCLPEDQRDPLATTSEGAGRLLLAALRAGVRDLLVGLGGSATVDGGAGALEALGARWRDRNGAAVPARGGGLDRVVSVDLSGLDQKLARIKGTLLCDVENPLMGPKGAARTFGPQKGAGPEAVRHLEQRLRAVRSALERSNPAVRGLLESPGAGAAGGLAGGLAAALGWPLRPGAGAVLDQLGFADDLARSDLVITGEGQWDGDAHPGKVAHEVARRAHRQGIRVLVLTGRTVAPPPPNGEIWDGRSLPGRPSWLTGRHLVALAARALIRRP